MAAPVTKSAPLTPLGIPAIPDFRSILREVPASGATAVPIGLLDFYRKVISPIDGNRCEMAPTCSLYSQQAFKEYGLALGFILTADRLLHEADERNTQNSYVQGGNRRYLDPLDHNTYWLPAWMH
jgi:uncharacterized protein